MLDRSGGTAELADVDRDARRAEALLTTGALQSAIFNSANFSSIATDAKGVIQIFNVGAERMLGYAASRRPAASRTSTSSPTSARIGAASPPSCP